jgi:hypothetical protein
MSSRLVRIYEVLSRTGEVIATTEKQDAAITIMMKENGECYIAYNVLLINERMTHHRQIAYFFTEEHLKQAIEDKTIQLDYS